MPGPLRKICFMVMPFGVKDTGAPAPAPAQVDFNALWSKALQPALTEMGYRAVRADQEVGSMIIKDMLQRLYFADLVVADISIPNANAYYEVGIRHAAKTDGCVLIGADWAKPVFDLGQIRRLGYPLPKTVVDDADAAAIKAALQPIREMAAGRTPMFECIDGYPNVPPDLEKAHSLAEQLEDFEHLAATLHTVFDLPAAERPARVDQILAEHPPQQVELALVAVELVKFVRDAGGDWNKTIAVIDALPESLRKQPWMKEQRALAQSKQGDHHAAIAAIKALIEVSGDSSERQGLLGGRYKKLYNASAAAGKPDRQLLASAIKHYERGTLLDVRDYFPSCNLPALYRERNNRGDEAKAVAMAAVARTACESAKLRGSGDEWLRPTLLGMAFAERSPDAAEQLAEEIEAEKAVGWKLETTLADLRRHVAQTQDEGTREALAAIVERLNELSPAG
jgi:hypothetical protein